MSPLPHQPGPHWGEVGIHGLHRPREWDAVALVASATAVGERLGVVVLADGSFVLEHGEDSFNPAEFVRSVELPPPYRLEAIRRSRSTWALGARAILVVELAGLPFGDEVEIVWDGTERSVRIDGEPSFSSVPELEALASARFDAWVVRAARLRGRLWEVELGSL